MPNNENISSVENFVNSIIQIFKYIQAQKIYSQEAFSIILSRNLAVRSLYFPLSTFDYQRGDFKTYHFPRADL